MSMLTWYAKSCLQGILKNSNQRGQKAVQADMLSLRAEDCKV